NLRVLLYLVLDLQHMVCHDGTDGKTGGEKEICDIDLVLIEILGNGISILVDQFEIRDLVIFPHLLYGRIHQFSIYHVGLVNGQSLFWCQDRIDNGDQDCRKHQQKNAKEFIFCEELKHEKCTLRKFTSN